MRAFNVLLLLTSIFGGVGGAICVIVRVMLRLLHFFYCIYLLFSTGIIILVLYANDSYSEWSYTWLAEFVWFCWFLIFSGVC